jgi:hypothetical protein
MPRVLWFAPLMPMISPNAPYSVRAVSAAPDHNFSFYRAFQRIFNLPKANSLITAPTRTETGCLKSKD